MSKTIFLFAVFVLFTVKMQAQTVTDIDGNVYNTVTIGTQIWMKENLKVTRYNDGASLPNITDSIDWNYITMPAYCNYDNDTNNVSIYGRLYNWYAAEFSVICPTGWHIPSLDEWTTLETYLGGDSIAGGKMKETGILHWQSPNIGATNSSGFSALPAGRRMDGLFSSVGIIAAWWTTEETGSTTAFFKYISNEFENLYMTNAYMSMGFSVRCICDSSANQINEINNKDDLNIYPNPANENITIETTDISKQQTITIYNMQGQLLIQQAMQQPKTDIDISRLAKGVYVIKLGSSDGVAVRKFIVR